MAYVQLKNSGRLTPEGTNFDKTKVVRISSARIGKDLHRQTHRVTFFRNAGDSIVVITVNDASSEECSMSAVDVYLIERKL